MKNLTHSFFVRCMAILLFTLLCTGTVLSGLGALFLMESGCYERDGVSYFDTGLCLSSASDYAHKAGMLYRNRLWNEENLADGQPAGENRYGYETDFFAQTLDTKNTNFRYSITDERGDVLYENIGGAEVVPVATEATFELRENLPEADVTLNADGVEIHVSEGSKVEMAAPAPKDPDAPGSDGQDGADGQDAAEAPAQWIQVNAYLARAMPVNDEFKSQQQFFDWLNSMRNTLVVCLFAGTILCILLFVFLMCAAGKRAGAEEPALGLFDKIPFDLYFCFSACAVVLCICGVAALGDAPLRTAVTLAAALIAVAAYFCLMCCMTFAVRIKTRTFWKNNLIWMAGALCIRILRWMKNGIKRFFLNLPVAWRSLLAVFGVVFVELMLYASARHSAFAAMLLLGFNICLVIAVSRATKQVKALLSAGERLAAGNMDEPVDTQMMYFDMKKHGENLNKVFDGLQMAVDERMKSERMKTDLITNVSHDLKTPLTSIISYVDLLKKEELQNERAAEYVQVLDRQAARLKKLTEDIVTASKASSGAINAERARTNLTETLSQSLAEYEERLSAARITPVVNTGDADLFVLADGKLLWRVFDNLFSNVVKYAQPDTRVYIDAKMRDGKAVVTVKNVSREPLNIPAEELFERFVRGDASRVSEGSGLGLSIARSLMELMKGSCELTIDGDLFTASLTLEAAGPAENA